jgi:thiamine biosynthesis protein ThiI
VKLLLRLSTDLTTKADKTRRRFLRMLVGNLRDAFQARGIAAHVEPGWVRLIVDADDEAAAEVARRVFGVHSVSRVEELERGSLEDLVAVAAPFFRPHVEGRTFAVRARTAGPGGYRSRDIEVALGAQLVPYGKVQLVDPQFTCHVEVRDRRIYLFSDSQPGWRGLPIGSEGRAVALVSGGFDSAVAAWMMLRRGVALDYVFCRLGGPAHQFGTLRVMQVLGEQWSAGDNPRIHIVPFEDVVHAIRAAAKPALWQLVLKRLMYHTAVAVARERRAHAVVTGESLGQVSSQTLRNLRALDGRLGLPVFRPLLGLDKEEIIARARDIGTYELSAMVHEYCDIVAEKPATGADARSLAAEEARVEFDVQAVLSQRRVFPLRELSAEALSAPQQEIDVVPPGAAVLDLRSLRSYRTWHYPGALHLEVGAAMQAIPHLDRGKTYVSYCEIGLKSAHVAYRMREAGLDAYSFRGGLPALARYAAQHALVPLELLPEATRDA